MAWRDHLKVHPACEMLPAMTPDELLGLSDDIRTNTLQERAKLIRDGNGYALIDGRSRLDALEITGRIQVFTGNVPNNKFFEVIDLEGRDPLTLVLSLNVHRRHLTAKQKRDLIAEVLKARSELSDKAIASTTKVTDKTVGAVRRKLEDGAEIPHHQSRVGRDGVQQTWPRARKAKPAVPGTGRKHRRPVVEPTPDDTEPGLPLEQPQEAKSSEPISLAPDVEPAPSNPLVEVALPPDPMRIHVAAVIGAVAALDRLPDDFDFHRMASIVDPTERQHLRGRVSRGMDILQGVWEALGESIRGPALTSEDPAPDIIEDMQPFEISEQIPPIPRRVILD
jgi:hypothetical protein